MFFFFSSRRRHTRYIGDWSSDVCSSDLNAILKSGTKELHGDAYEFFRNDVLNANEYFLNRQGQPRPVIKQNIFGGSLGGPVGNEKWGYFFLNYQGTRQRSGLSAGTFISTTIPTLPDEIGR